MVGTPAALRETRTRSKMGRRRAREMQTSGGRGWRRKTAVRGRLGRKPAWRR